MIQNFYFLFFLICWYVSATSSRVEPNEKPVSDSRKDVARKVTFSPVVNITPAALKSLLGVSTALHFTPFSLNSFTKSYNVTPSVLSALIVFRDNLAVKAFTLLACFAFFTLTFFVLMIFVFLLFVKSVIKLGTRVRPPRN